MPGVFNSLYPSMGDAHQYLFASTVDNNFRDISPGDVSWLKHLTQKTDVVPLQPALCQAI